MLDSGEFTLDGRTTRLNACEADLFAGRLSLTFWQAEFRCLGAVRNLPFDSAVEFDQLPGRTLRIANCFELEFENSWIPTFQLGDDVDVLFGISKLVVDDIAYERQSNMLSLRIAFEAIRNDSGVAIEVTANAIARYEAVSAESLMLRQEPIPVRYAGHYLSLLGLRPIIGRTTESDVVDLYGTPDDRGGGHHPTFGYVPDWIRYTTPKCHVRFALDAGVVTYVSIMPLGLATQ